MRDLIRGPQDEEEMGEMEGGICTAGAEVEVGVGEECVKQGLLVFYFFYPKYGCVCDILPMDPDVCVV